MGIDDLSKKASDLAAQASKLVKDNSGKIEEGLKSPQAEEISDKVLGGVADFANKITGGKHADKVEELRKNIDGKIGDQ